MGCKGTALLMAVTVAMLAAVGSASAGPQKSIRGEGTFAPYTPGATAVAYDSASVPAGASAQVRAWTYPTDHRTTTVVLTVRGLLPDHGYGAHVHMKSCGATADSSGSHYQNMPDPKQPSVDPQYANPSNEIWLDVMTDEHGIGYAETTVNWEPRAGQANSVVIHANHTSTEPGHAGTAGARLACLSVGF